MNSSSDNSSAMITPTIFSISLSRKITFSFLVALIIPSIICSLFVIYHVIRKKEIRNRLYNHTILCVFSLNLLQAISDLPLTIAFLYEGRVAIPSLGFCKYWFIAICAFDMCSLQLNAFLSIERYLLIFHDRTLHKYQIILHYIPLIVLISYPIPYSFSFLMFYPCENQFNYDAVVCGAACYTLQPILGIANWIFSINAPLIIIVLLNLFLIIRVIEQKRQMLQKNIWKKNSRMLLQLLSITGIQCIGWVPLSVISVIDVIQPTPILLELHYNWLLIGCIYLPVLCSPVTSIIAIPELKDEARAWIRQRTNAQNTQIHPTLTIPNTIQD